MARSTRVLAIAVLAMIVAACGAETHDAVDDDDDLWAECAESNFEAMTASLCSEADFESAAFFASGSLDFRMFGGSVVTTADEIASTLEYYLNDPTGERGETVLDDLYVSLDGAIASYRFFTSDRLNFGWAALYAVDGSKVTGRMYSFEDATGPPHWTPLLERGREIYDLYLVAWSRPDADSIAAVYAPDAVVVDSLSGTTYSGHEEILDGIDGEGVLEAGPWPKLVSFSIEGQRELIAIVQTSSGCPMREARRWIIRDDMIVEDVRYRHVPSVRRCGLDLADGWWADFAPQGGERAVSNLKIVIDGHVIEVVNAEWEQLEFLRWVFERYRVGLELPEAAAVWFPPSVDCGGNGSFARSTDPRFSDRPSVTFCMTDEELVDGRLGRRWTVNAARLGLHELAHLWIYDNLSVADQTAFMERAGVDSWRTEAWGESGVEQAAETIAWGLAGAEYVVYEIEPRPSCAELRARYEILTARLPVTPCPDESGG